MSIRERLLAFAAGSPIGNDRSPRPTEPYGEYELDRRSIRWSEGIFRFAVVSVALLVLGCAMSGIAYAAQKGQWNVNLGIDNMAPERQHISIKWSDVDKDKYVTFEHGGIKAYKIGYTVTTGINGSTVEGPVYYDKNDKVVDKSHSKRKKYTGGLQKEDLKKNFEPSWAPDGWEKAASASTSVNHGNHKPHESQGSESKDPEDLENQLIKDHPPKFALNLNSLSICRKFGMVLLPGPCRECDQPRRMVYFTGVLHGGYGFHFRFHQWAFCQFYTMASTLSKNAFQPYAFAFLGLTFGVALCTSSMSAARWPVSISWRASPSS